MTPRDRAPARLLVADDQPDVLEALRLLFKGEGFALDIAASPGAVLEAVKLRAYDILLIDLNYTRDTTSGQEGLDLLTRLQALDADLPIVVMTAWGSVDLAVEAMRRGARDFIQKPWDNARLLAVARAQIELHQALRRERRLEAENLMLRGEGGPRLIAASPAMRPVLELIARVGPSDANVLLTGENGTGKGVVAASLHAASERSGRPMVVVNAGGFSEGLFESELFGHVKGAFTDARGDRVGRFELADGGTLFLDEIANVPQGPQAKLLRILETGEFEPVGGIETQQCTARLIVASNLNLEQAADRGRFRLDLYYRLNVMSFHLPPLRERVQDIAPLARGMAARFNRKFHKELFDVSPEALAALESFPWPGNIRQLENVVQQAVLVSTGPELLVQHLPQPVQDHAALALMPSNSPASPGGDTLHHQRDVTERNVIQRALATHGYSRARAADALGISRVTLYKKMKKYGLMTIPLHPARAQ